MKTRSYRNIHNIECLYYFLTVFIYIFFIDMSSSVLTQYEILEQPSGHGENQVGKFPVTSEPHSWSQNGAKASYTSSRCLQIFCVFLSIIFYHNHVESFQFVRETVHKKRKSSSIRTHSRNRIALPD